jgi:hypothetical protein
VIETAQEDDRIRALGSARIAFGDQAAPAHLRLGADDPVRLVLP